MDLRRQRELFERALALPLPERDAFLSHACPDPEQRAHVQRLLDAHARIESSDGAFLRSPAPSTLDPTNIGPYRLLEPIGSGGMGEVYLAEQVEPVRRRVALKLLRSTLGGPDLLARFDVERQALALLEHPNVARILDAGATDAGRPYVVVEYVSGPPVTAYCDQHRLSLRQRLDLFLQVCAGVQHAHQRGVIHRDLKPSNVLVTEVDGLPTPKIIDFGIAKAMGSLAGVTGPYTQAGQIIGTPDYMSPEQAELSPFDVDTRADVYSLGVILSELLCGELPHAPIAAGAGPLQIARGIAGREPIRPSQLARRAGDRLNETARLRGTSSQSLRAELGGDLDWIVLKALEPDRRRRYDSAAELAADIVRYRRSEPVVARAPDTAYLASRFIRRNRVPVTVAAALFASLVAFSVLMTQQAREIARERDRAATEAETARRVSQFLVETLQAADPEKHLGAEPTARRLLDEAATRLEGSLQGEPAAKARLELAFGEIYHMLGEYSLAQDHLRRSLALHESLDMPDDRGRLTALRLVGRGLGQLGKVAEAEKVTQQVISETRGRFGESDSLYVDAIHDLGVVRHLQGRYKEALDLYGLAWRARESALGPTHVLTATAQTNVAVIHQLLGNSAESERLYLGVIDGMSREHGEDNPQVLIARLNLSTLYATDGDFERALVQQQQIVPRMRRIYGDDHPYTLNAVGNLAATLSNLGRHRESYAQNAATVRSLTQKRGATHPVTLFYRANLAYDMGRLGQREEAQRDLAEIIRLQYEQLGHAHRDTINSQSMLANLRRAWGEYRAAIDLLERALAGSREGLGAAHKKTGEILLMLADSTYAAGDESAARQWVHEAREAGADLAGQLTDYPELARRRTSGTLPH